MSEDKRIFWEENVNPSFDNHTLILPDISVGNVGQLSVDLLINNLDAEFLGRIVHPCFYPFIGSDPFHSDSSRLSSSCEIYHAKEKKLVIIQLRSRVFPNKVEEFKDLILKFIQMFQFKMTVLVASSSSEYFSAQELSGIPTHYLNTSSTSKLDCFIDLHWKKFALPDSVEEFVDSSIPGSFISEKLLASCEEQNIPLVVLICICSEGYNYPEALQMIDCLNSWFSLKQEMKGEQMWKMPVSWKLPYGCDAPVVIHG